MAATMTTKATLYLDSKMYMALKLQAVQSRQSVSSLVDKALKAQLSEDLEDITTIRERLAKKEEPLSYEAALQELRASGVL